MLKDSKITFGWVSIFFHWVTALTVFGLFGVGLWMVDLDYYSEWYRTAPHWHKSIGLLLCGLIIFRLIWRKISVKPRPLGTNIETKLATLGHAILYVLLIALFVSGYLISTADNRDIDVFNWFTVPGFGSFIENQEDIAGSIHEWLAYSLMALVTIHAAASLKHHFINRDNTLLRMLSPKPESSTEEK